MKVAVLIDGGHLRAFAANVRLTYTPDFIEALALNCIRRDEGEVLLRVLYYDCPQFRGKRAKAISGKEQVFTATDTWLEDLASRDLLAVRRGTLVWRGWQLRRPPPVLGQPLTDEDFRPNFEQKGVDMRIGLDIATFSAEKSVDRIILVSADTDMIPALKHARRAGLQTIGVQLPRPALPLHRSLLAHLDFRRDVSIPVQAIESPL